MTDVSLLSPVGAWRIKSEMGRKAHAGMENLVAKVVQAAANQAFGRGLLEEVYLAGFYHGAEMMERRMQRDATPNVVASGDVNGK